MGTTTHTKQCITCSKIYPNEATFFRIKDKSRLSRTCRSCQKIIDAKRIDEDPAYAAGRRTRQNARRKIYRKPLTVEQIAKHKEWRKANMPSIRLSQRASEKRLMNEPKYKARRAVKRYLYCARLKKSDLNSLTKFLGYSFEELSRHLERQFSKGMTWSNYGTVWHIDHVIPVSSFNIKAIGDDEFRACWALPNLRPLWAGENASKGAKRTLLL